jgi:hypothetical protein
MLDDVLFLLIIAGMALSVAYIRSEMRDARRHRYSQHQEPN